MPRRAASSIRRQRGRSWIELAVAAVILAVLAAVLLEAMRREQERAESVAVELTVRNLRSGLRWAVAERLMRAHAADLADLPGSNPVSWLARPPPGYLGELAVEPEAAAGVWYFDLRRRQLVYRPRSHRFLEAGDPGVPELRWRIVALKENAGAADIPRDIALVVERPYRWFGP